MKKIIEGLKLAAQFFVAIVSIGLAFTLAGVLLKGLWMLFTLGWNVW